MSKQQKSSDLVFARGKWLVDETEVQRLLADSDPEEMDDDINDPDFTIHEAIVEQIDFDHEHDNDDDDDDEEVHKIISPNNTITETPVVQSTVGGWIVSDFERRIQPVVDACSPNIDLKLPIGYFRRYFDDQHFDDAAMYTNMYYFNKKGILLKTTPSEIMKLYGMFLIMGCIPFPRITLYWKAGYNLDKISSAMTKNRFKVLRTSLHYADVSRIPEEAKSNMFWQVSPIIEAVRNRCHNIERFVDRYSIDEQMIPFTGRCPGRQFVRNKPRPVGLKNFVVTTTRGLVLDFEIYQGTKTKLPDMSLGLGPAVVLRLIKTLPEGSFLYFDRYFTTIPLLKKLEALNYKATGTIQQNRLKGLRFKDDKRMIRGESDQFVYDNTVTAVKWRDAKSVLIASTICGTQPETLTERWSKKDKKYIQVTCPSIITEYNSYMGGVDLCDQMMEYYRTFIKTVKWSVKVSQHFIDLAVVNAWQEYRLDCESQGIPKKNVKDLLEFRLEIGNSLLSTSLKRPHPNSDSSTSSENEDDEHEKINKRIKTTSLPSLGKRYDGYYHWPTWDRLKAPRMCRLKSCTSRTRNRCKKCDVYLCSSADKSCFEIFHTVKD